MRQTFRKILMMACMTLAGMLCANAENLQEVVYLKNGSVIRGVILEMIPDKTVRIQTVDGNIFVYEMSQVEKITKEKAFRNEHTTRFGTSDCCSDSDYKPYGWEKAPRYRGFVGLTTVLGLTEDYINLTLHTVHGAQITPNIFIGAGVGITTWSEYYSYDSYGEITSGLSIPVFANIRGEIHNILRKNFSPYLDIKLGYNLGDINGVLFTPEAGCHFYFGHKKLGLGFGIGYNLQQSRNTEYYYAGYNSYSKTYDHLAHGIVFSVSLDF